MTIFVRRFLSKALLPNFEHELQGSIATQVATVPAMVDNMLAPQAYMYYSPSASSSNTFGAYQTTTSRADHAKPPVSLLKVNVPMQNHGLFHE
jgi:hypothetical protein